MNKKIIFFVIVVLMTASVFPIVILSEDNISLIPQKHNQTISFINNEKQSDKCQTPEKSKKFELCSPEILKNSTDQVCDSVYLQEKVIKNLSNIIGLVAVIITIMAVFVTLLSYLSYKNIKELFVEKLERNKEMVMNQSNRIEGLRPIFEKNALEMAERDLTKVIEKMKLKDEAVLNQSRVNLSLISVGKDTQSNFEALIDSFENTQSFSGYVGLLLTHPSTPLAEIKLDQAFYYFLTHPSFYILPILDNIMLDWRDDIRIIDKIKELKTACEKKNPAPGSYYDEPDNLK